MKWVYLSYELSSDLSMYGNGQRIEIKQERSIAKGDTSNNTSLSLPAHYGTHIDYPFHFGKDGTTGSEYSADFFVFGNVQHAEIDPNKESLLIEFSDLKFDELNSQCDFLIVKTGMSSKREHEDYWNRNFGFAPGIANDLRKAMPNLRAIGFDSISLTSYQHREDGRVAHREFLLDNKILIVEDMDLLNYSAETVVERLIVAPLRFSQADGSPVTVMALVK